MSSESLLQESLSERVHVGDIAVKLINMRSFVRLEALESTGKPYAVIYVCMKGVRQIQGCCPRAVSHPLGIALLEILLQKVLQPLYQAVLLQPAGCRVYLPLAIPTPAGTNADWFK